MERYRKPGTLVLAAIVAASFVLPASADDKEVRKHVEAALELLGPNSPPKDFQQMFAGGFQGKFMVGIAMLPVGPTLASQLKIDGGVAIGSVMEGSPAAAAGLQQHDVIIAFAGKPVEGPVQLSRAVAEAGEKEVEVKFIRQGKEKVIKLTAQPTKEIGAEHNAIKGHAEVKQLFELLGKEHPNFTERMLLVEPLILKSNGDAVTKLPENVRIKIEKQGDTAAKISVSVGDKTWDVTEKNIDELPEDVRPHVRRFLDKSATPRVEGMRLQLKQPDDGAKQAVQQKALILRGQKQQVEEAVKTLNAIQTQKQQDGLDDIRKAQQDLMELVKQLQRQVEELKKSRNE